MSKITVYGIKCDRCDMVVTQGDYKSKFNALRHYDSNDETVQLTTFDLCPVCWTAFMDVFMKEYRKTS